MKHDNNGSAAPMGKYGEPWTHEVFSYPVADTGDYGATALLRTSNGRIIAQHDAEDDGDDPYFVRAIACVNLLAGHDPSSVAVVPREVLEEVKQFINMMHCGGRGIECFPPNPYDGRDTSPEWELLNSLVAKLSTLNAGGASHE